jgi:phage protein D
LKVKELSNVLIDTRAVGTQTGINMADLMSDTFTFADLAGQYGNFRVPAVKVLVGGSDPLRGGVGGISQLRIALSLAQASAVTFRVEGAYDPKNRSFEDGLKSKFTLGKTLEVQIGYQSQLETVFKGYIASVGIHMEETAYLAVTAVDARRLMMESAGRIRIHQKQKYSEIVSEILGDYADLCAAQVESTGEAKDAGKKQHESDFAFVQRLAKQAGMEFFLFGEKAYFRTPRKVAAPILTLEYGISLLSFTAHSDYRNLKVIASGYDKKEQAAIFGDKEATGKGQTNATKEPQIRVMIEADAQTQNELLIRAKWEADQQLWKAQSGNGKSIGLPCLVPGRFLKIDHVDTDWNQKYYLTEVTHLFDQEGYFTEFHTEGWE